jgi:hypothetical protein
LGQDPDSAVSVLMLLASTEHLPAAHRGAAAHLLLRRGRWADDGGRGRRRRQGRAGCDRGGGEARLQRRRGGVAGLLCRGRRGRGRHGGGGRAAGSLLGGGPLPGRRGAGLQAWRQRRQSVLEQGLAVKMQLLWNALLLVVRQMAHLDNNGQWHTSTQGNGSMPASSKWRCPPSLQVEGVEEGCQQAVAGEAA